MDWQDPQERRALSERVGEAEYNRRLLAHWQAATIETVAGHDIRSVHTKGVRRFHVGLTAMKFPLLDDARAYARQHPLSSKGEHDAH